MATGFDSVYTCSGYAAYSSLTGIQTQAKLTQTIDTNNRTVTVSAEVSLALYRISTNWNIPANNHFTYASNSSLSVNLDGTTQSLSGMLGMTSAVAFTATPGNTYGYFGGYVTANTSENYITVSKTYNYDSLGTAITGTLTVTGSYNNTTIPTLTINFQTDELVPEEPSIDVVSLNSKTFNSFNIHVEGTYNTTADGRYMGAFVMLGEDYTDLTKIRYEQISEAENENFDISNTSSGQLLIQSNSTYTLGAYINNVNFEDTVYEVLGEYTTLPAKPVAENFQTIDIRSSRFTITETSLGVAKRIQLQYRYKPSDVETWGDWQNAGSANNKQSVDVTLTGLDSNLTYDVQIRSLNSDNEESEIVTYDDIFTTNKVISTIISRSDSASPTPEKRDVLLTVAFSSTVTQGTVYDYIYRYKKNAETTWTEVSGTSSTAIIDIELELDKATLYDFGIKARVDGGYIEEYGDEDMTTFRVGGGAAVMSLNASAAFSTTTCKDIPLWEV